MTSSRRGAFVVLEGVDASGKSTQAALLAERRGALLTREPGGTPIGERIRSILLSPQHDAMDDRAEALLYAAARAQHVAEVIIPNLAEGTDVVSDRFVASSIVYQGIARGLGVDEVTAINDFGTGGLRPDLVVLVEIPVDVALERLAGVHDRLEQEGARFLDAAAQGFAALATAHSATWVAIDGVGTVAEVADRIGAATRERLGW